MVFILGENKVNQCFTSVLTAFTLKKNKKECEAYENLWQVSMPYATLYTDLILMP